MIDEASNQNDQNYLKSLHLLYVEDEDDVRTQMVDFLQRRVKKVYAAVNGEQGLELFGQYDINLVITDIRMPLMDGLAMAEHIRAMSPKIPIIITTAFEDTRYFTRAIDLSVDKYIVKPIDINILNNTLLAVARQLRAEAALREIEGRYRLLFKLSNISISVNDFTEANSDKLGVLDLTGEIIDCNDAFLTLLGYDQRDILDHKWFIDLLMPSSIILLNRYVRDEVLVKDISREFEVVLRHCNGSKVPVWLQLILRRDGLGKAIEIWAVMRDQTEEIKARDSLQLAASVFECTSEAIMITDANNCIISVNKAFSRVTGYSQDEVLGQNPSLLKSGKHNQEFYQLLWDNLLAMGHWQGEIWNRRKDDAMYPEWLSISLVRNDAGQIVNYISIFSDMTERKELSANLEFLAHYDSLTHVPNRIMLENLVRQSLAVASRNRSQLAFLFIDLDRFKNINDSLGHSVGDEVLKIVAMRLRQSLREMDIVARLGGDEFVVVLVNPKVADDIIIVCNKLCGVLRQPMSMGDYDLVVTPSIGISVFPKDASNYETLLKNADTAMYKAKQCGRDNYMFYSEAMNIEVVKVLNMESALRNAMAKEEFELNFQPQLSLDSQRLVGMEVLLRWNSPQLGRVPPVEFIPLAEDCGIIVKLGEWVLREACRQNVEWQKQGLPTVVIAVNLSALQFKDKNLLSIIKSALEATMMAPEYLELELTESIVMNDSEFAIANIQALKNLKLKLSIDDFGTGYSSLSYLKRFAIDKLKIDQSFIADIGHDKGDEAIIKAIISLAKALGQQVIAEGVETQEQMDFLRENHCHEIQGYLYSKPLSAKDMTAFLQQVSEDNAVV